MDALRRLFLVGAATVLIHEPFASCKKAKKVLETEVVDCLKEFNAARSAAGLHALVPPVQRSLFNYSYSPFKLLNHDPEMLVENQCLDVYLTFKVDREGHSAFTGGEREYEQALSEVQASQLEDDQVYTSLYFQQDGPADCKAAVKAWTAAGRRFKDPPPEYGSRFESEYLESENRSFIALFNPKKDATMECIRIKCSTPKYGTSVEADALLCMTDPPALDSGKRPFTDDQWKNIKKSITSEGSSVPKGTPSSDVHKRLTGDDGTNRNDGAKSDNSGKSNPQIGLSGTKHGSKSGAGDANKPTGAEGANGAKGTKGGKSITSNNTIAGNSGARDKKSVTSKGDAEKDKGTAKNKDTARDKGAKGNNGVTGNNGATSHKRPRDNDDASGGSINPNNGSKDAGDSKGATGDNGTHDPDDREDKKEGNEEDSNKHNSGSTHVSTTAATVFILGFSVLSIFSYL